MSKIRPLQDRVIVRRVKEEEKSKGGIIIPDTAKEKPIEGEVMAVGSGKILEDGTVRQLDVKAGDRVLFGKYSGTEVKLDGEDRLIIREDDILGVLERATARCDRRPVATFHEDFIITRSPNGSERNRLHRAGAQSNPCGRQRPRQRGEGHPRSQGPQRRHREELRLARRSPRTA